MKKVMGALLILIGVVLMGLGGINLYGCSSALTVANLPPETSIAAMVRGVLGLAFLAVGFKSMKAGRKRFSPAVEHAAAPEKPVV